jgi:hypothetical protein
MVSSSARWWLGASLSLGCAASSPHSAATTTGGGPAASPTSRHAASTATAERIYALAEQRYARGDYPAAVALLRRALLQLPESAVVDARRHALILRIGHTQMRAWSQTGDEAFLVDAQQMLERYAIVHAELFGDDAAAQRERDDIWALLGQVELRIQQPERMAAEDAAGERAGRRAAAASGGSSGDDESGAPPDDHRGEALTPEIEREVVVKSRRLATLEDPRVVRRLKSDYSLAEAGLVLTKQGGGDPLHEARGLVRAPRPPATTDEGADAGQRRVARRLGYRVLKMARPALRRCYEDAMSRDPVLVADSTVEVSVRPDGKLGRARIVEGQLVDALGDVCMIEKLEQARLDDDSPAQEVRVRLALRFLFQDAHYPDGPRTVGPPPTRREEPSAPTGVTRSDPPLDAMPGIDAFTD